MIKELLYFIPVIIYYIYVIFTFMLDKYDSKRELFLSMIPFKDLVIRTIVCWKRLK